MSTYPRRRLDLSGIVELGTILSIWAHPDDETYVAGGVMAAAVAAGQRVTCVSATAGEQGTDDPSGWPPQRLGQVRRWEAAAAMAVLGVTDHRFLDLPDGGLAQLDPNGPVRTLAELILKTRPDTILTFGPDGGTFHPDHRTVSAWVGRAWRIAGQPGRLLHAATTRSRLATWGEAYERWGVFMTDERPVGVPDEALALDVALPQALLDQKIAALCAMYTQVSPSVAALGMNRFRALNAQESFVDVA
jgi:LmbE family N-acetylglucosaminyl deacetylase